MSLSKFFGFIKVYQREVVLVVVVILVSISSYNIGKIVGADRTRPEIKILDASSAGDTRDLQQANILNKTTGDTDNTVPKQTPTPKPVIDFSTIQVIASKNSSGKVYHFLWCPSVAKIKEENKITFTNEAEAIGAGYKLAGNCTK